MTSIGLSMDVVFIREDRGCKLSARLGACQWGL
jgi:hypothetical protein